MAGHYCKDEFSSRVLEKVFVNFELNNRNGVNHSINEDGNSYTFIFWYEYVSSLVSQFSYRIKDAVIGNNMVEKLDNFGKIYGSAGEKI